MNTTKLKTFAAEARNTLKRGVMNRILTLGFDEQGHVVQAPQEIEGGAVFMGETLSEDFYKKWVNLRQRIEEKSLREVLEEAAYTWFNRLMAIRIMQMNRLIDPVLDYRSDSVKLPILLTDAMRGALPAMPDDERVRLKRLLIDPTRTAEQFALLITAFCHNTPVIDRCFGKIADYTELLLPNDILEENGFLDRLNHTDFISEEDYKTPELIGWLYQFYISERKDEVFAKKGKYTPDEIPAATQIFTPNWIVKYMVQNTVGRIYLDNNPYEDELKAKWKYLVDTDEQGSKLDVDDIEDLKVADLACGSGHILNECFDLLLDIYVNSCGYSPRQAIESIFKNNLTGIDLDTRAKQLATFALLLKACQRDENFIDAHIMPRVLDMPHVDRYTWRDLGGHMTCALEIHKWGERIAPEIDECFTLMEHADSLGSIMKFDISPETREFILECVNQQNLQQKYVAEFADLFKGFELILALTEKYSALVMNPPYMGFGSMEDNLSKYIKSNYEEGKADLFATFMILAIDRLEDYGKYGMINMHSWMFLSSFERLRHTILEEQTIDSLLHLGPHTFDELSGEVVQNAAFVISKSHKPNSVSCYYRLVDGKDCANKEQLFSSAQINKTPKVFYGNVKQNIFDNIPEKRMGFWLSPQVIAIWEKGLFDDSVIKIRQGLATGDNEKFIRIWHEVSFENFNRYATSCNDAISSGYKWFPFHKGGQARSWYGNSGNIISFDSHSYEILRNQGNHLPSKELYFLEGILFSRISSKKLNAKYTPAGFVFDGSAPLAIPTTQLKEKLGYMCSKVIPAFLQVLSPATTFQVGDVRKSPFIGFENNTIETLVSQNVNISREDWDSHETSWDFKCNGLIELVVQAHENWPRRVYTIDIDGQHDFSVPPKRADTIKSIVDDFKQKWTLKFIDLHNNEEELNRQFINIYGLQDELTPDVPLDEVTILQQGEISIENNEIVWHDDVLMKQLISYAVGCWMGRYRLDKPGLHIAHTDATKEEITPYEYNGEQFVIDDDGIIPLMPKDSMFHDNAALRIADFVRQVFGTETQVENLNYIEQALGKSLEQYFIKDFWKDHKKMYQNRPIYWLFSSKKGAFQCIAYMHRMNKYTPEIVRQKYLLPHMDDLRKRIADMEQRAVDLNTQERRSLDTMQKQLAECMEYHDRLHPVADKQIDFDLDDGVVVNYAKFGDILAKLK